MAGETGREVLEKGASTGGKEGKGILSVLLTRGQDGENAYHKRFPRSLAVPYLVFRHWAGCRRPRSASYMSLVDRAEG